MVEEGILLKDVVYLKQSLKTNFIIRVAQQSDIVELKDAYKGNDER